MVVITRRRPRSSSNSCFIVVRSFQGVRDLAGCRDGHLKYSFLPENDADPFIRSSGVITISIAIDRYPSTLLAFVTRFSFKINIYFSHSATPTPTTLVLWLLTERYSLVFFFFFKLLNGSDVFFFQQTFFSMFFHHPLASLTPIIICRATTVEEIESLTLHSFYYAACLVCLLVTII